MRQAQACLQLWVQRCQAPRGGRRAALGRQLSASQDRAAGASRHLACSSQDAGHCARCMQQACRADPTKLAGTLPPGCWLRTDGSSGPGPLTGRRCQHVYCPVSSNHGPSRACRGRSCAEHHAQERQVHQTAGLRGQCGGRLCACVIYSCTALGYSCRVSFCHPACPRA